GEYFVAVYAADGSEVVAPRAIPQAEAEAAIISLAGPAVRAVGAPTTGWKIGLPGEHCDLPTASATAWLAVELDPAISPAVPRYVRGANALKPTLPPSPLRAS